MFFFLNGTLFILLVNFAIDLDCGKILTMFFRRFYARYGWELSLDFGRKD
jgi:hypothetical protein